MKISEKVWTNFFGIVDNAKRNKRFGSNPHHYMNAGILLKIFLSLSSYAMLEVLGLSGGLHSSSAILSSAVFLPITI